VIATEGTVRGGAYQQAILRRKGDARVSAVATQLFVALAEEGLCDGPIAAAVARHYLGALFDCGAADAPPDTLVLGCTHFPMLATAIAAVVGPEVQIVDSAATTARTVRRCLEGSSSGSDGGRGALRLLATDAPERFARVGTRFLTRRIEAHEVELIDL
jgi:glutamate racemase